MWCARCHADVAAEVSPDNARARCASCGTELGLAAAVRAADKTREARELLERWSNNRTLDPYGPVLAPKPALVDAACPADGQVAAGGSSGDPHDGLSSVHDGTPRRAVDRRTAGPSQPRTFRVDVGHAQPTMHQSRRALEPEPMPDSADSPPHQHVSAAPGWSDDAPAAVALRQPGRTSRRLLNVPRALFAGEREQTNWFQLAGHLLAYSGALVLTLGTALVLLGYFGGPPKMHFTPTGWLIATFGQLLLVSGVITLVSSGMERTTHEVSSRIDALGDKLLRYEQAAGRAFPAGPSLPAERFSTADGRATQRRAERV